MSVHTQQRSVAARALIFLVQLYRTWISPTRLPSCRFEPTCSSYAVEALNLHGAVRGTGLAVWRLLKCAPWHPGGWDPVPPSGNAWPRSAKTRSK
ncbi:MAG: membrane protein insertion efficiency factor YidD [Mycobacteriaceae bacterium]